MATKNVKNNSNQPLYFNLPGGRSLKIPARSTVEVDEADLNSSEMAFHQNRGSISVVEMAAAAGAQSEPEQGADSQPSGGTENEKGGEE